MTDDAGRRGDRSDERRRQPTESESSEWATNRERVAYEEARHVLEAQRSDVGDIDDKALRTVRITALLLGVGATGARVIGVSNLNRLAAAVSLSSFLVSLAFGVIVYNESNEFVGPSAGYLGKMRRDDLHARWEVDLLVQFEQWIERNREVVAFNAYLLGACQTFLVVGVGFGAASLLSLDVDEIVLVGAVLVVLVVTTLSLFRWWVRSG